MKYYWQNYRWLVFVLVLVVGIIGCQSENRQKELILIPTSPVQLTNFWAADDARGDYESFYYAEGDTVFELDVPAGDWALGYETDSGFWTIVFRARRAATLHIGVHAGEIVHWVGTIPGTIIRGSKILARVGPVDVYSWPKNPIPPEQVFIPAENTSSTMQNQASAQRRDRK